MLTWFVSGALGAEVALVAGVEAEIAAARLARLSIDTAPTSFADLLTPRVGATPLAPCADPDAAATMAERVDRGRNSALYEDYAIALTHFAEAEKQAACLTTPIDNALLSDLYFYRGLSLAATGDSEGAQGAFQRSQLVGRAAPWDDTFPAGKELFKAAAAAAYSQPPTRLYLRPLPADELLLVDGRDWRATQGFFAIPPADRYIQLGNPLMTLRVALNPGETELFVPSLNGADASWADDAAQRPGLMDALELALAEGTPLVIATRDHVWRTSVGAETWTDLWEPVTTGAAAQRKTGGLLLGGGVGLALGSAALAAAATLEGHSAFNAGEDARDGLSPSDYDDALSRSSTARTLQTVGFAGSAIGGGIAGAGLAIHMKGRKWR